jgi:phosphate transport system permease protein
VLSTANYQALVRQSLLDLFPSVDTRQERRELYGLISPGATYHVRNRVMEDPSIIGQRIHIRIPVSDDFDQYAKGHISAETAEAGRRISDQQIAWFERLKSRGLVERTFNTTFFTAGDSRSPELAGIWGALVGSFWTMLITLLLSFPLAVGASIYLEEFAPKNRLTDIIEVNVNNLAAVPSIVFGLLGLAVFINFFGLPRSAPLVGGMVLALMTLPTIIIASRAALKAVPPSIREAALGVGASKMQSTFHHVVPLALPGMLTGTIIGMAQALGETAPLLMIGMVAFIVDIPSGPLDPATVMPVQVYLWSDAPERAFVERASAAIIVLLGFLVIMNMLAVLLRKQFETKW